MKKPLISNRFLIICFCIFAAIVILFMVNTYLYVRASQLKIVEGISSSDSILLQNEFGIDLPPEAEITRLGYCSDLIVIRIEGVEDLSSFLTNSMHLELDRESLQTLTDSIEGSFDGDTSPYKDMYGTERQSSVFYNSEYQSNRVDLTMTDFFLLDGKLIVEISNTYFVTENRARFREIVNR